MSSTLTLVSASGLLDLAIKSLAVMLLSLVVVMLLRPASAAWRHLTWSLSLLCLLLLPALLLALPAWQVSLLPQWVTESLSAVAASGPPDVTPTDTSGTLALEAVRAIGSRTSDVTQPETSAAEKLSTLLLAEVVEADQSARGSIPWLTLGWMAGGLLSFLPLAIGLCQLLALHRRSRVIDDPRLLKLLDETRWQLQVRHRVQLRRSEALLIPVTWGAFRPVLLLPVESSDWQVARQKLVLLHELGHVSRWDWFTQLMAHVACPVYWFNPFVWLAARQMRIERERACDDLVLGCGIRPSDFAQELVAFAAGLSNSRLLTLAAAPMARRGALEDRISAILDRRRNRTATTKASVCLGMTLAIAAVAPVAALRADAAKATQTAANEAPEDADIANTPEQADQTPADTPTVKADEKRSNQAVASPITVRGKVVDDATGRPVEQFIVQSGTFDPSDPGFDPTDPRKVRWLIGEQPQSVPDGSFSTTVCWADGRIARIVSDGYLREPVLKSAPPADKQEIDVTIRLRRVPEKVRGVVLDHTGKPVKDAAVFAVGAQGLVLAAGQAWSRGWAREGKQDEDAHPVMTDEQGRFEIPTNGATLLGVTHARFDAWPAAVPANGDVMIRLPQPARVEIKLDIEGAGKDTVIFYQLLSHLTPEFGNLESTRWVSMANPGKLVFDALPPGKYQFCRRPGQMLDREIFDVKAGESKFIDYVRSKGARVRGKVTWPADAKLESIVVSVLGENDAVHASLSPSGDGTFLTERIPPGTHSVIAYAFEPQTPERLRNTSPIIPTFHAEPRTIVVPAEGEVTAEDLALMSRKPTDTEAATQPKQAAKTDAERMLGNWFIMNEDSGRKGEMWVISKDHILMHAKHGGANSSSYTYRIDASKTPKQIDVNEHVRGFTTGPINGIYAFDRDELRLCLPALGKNRPAEFASKPGVSELLILQRAASGASPPKAMTSEEQLRLLIDKVLAAHGGEDRLNKLTSFTMTVKHSNGYINKYWVRPPTSFRWETTFPNQTAKWIVILFPEGRRWWTREPNEAAGEFIPSGAEPRLEYWFDYVKFFGPRQVLRLKDADHKVALLDEAKIGDRAAMGVHVIGPQFNRKMYFDKETHLLLKGPGADVREATFSGYKTFDGIPIALKGDDGHFMPEVTDFRAVDKFDAKLFEQP